MGGLELSGDELLDALCAPVEPPFAGGLAVVSDPLTLAVPDRVADARISLARRRLATLPCVVVAGPSVDVGSALERTRDAVDPALDGGTDSATSADGDAAHRLAGLVDLAVATDDDLTAVVEAVERTPLASTALALHLRGVPGRPLTDGLVAESALYSALQAGPEHAAWRGANPPRRRAAERAGAGDGDGGQRLRAAHEGDELRLTLTRPAVRNALDTALRDELLTALAVAEADPDLSVVIAGEGPSFCAGGDLDEFGTAPDPATAHVIRLRTSIGAVLARLADRTTVVVHGPTAGSGVELAAFAGRVLARPDATFVLPELTLGLIPGAGGTVSLPRRIGRHRTAWLALTGRAIDAGTAAAWGLVDELADP